MAPASFASTAAPTCTEKREVRIGNEIAHPKPAEGLAITDAKLELVAEAAGQFGEAHRQMNQALNEKVEAVEAGRDQWPWNPPLPPAE